MSQGFCFSVPIKINKIHQPTCLGQSLVRFCEETSFVNLSSPIHLQKITCTKDLSLFARLVQRHTRATTSTTSHDHNVRVFSVDFIAPKQPQCHDF